MLLPRTYALLLPSVLSSLTPVFGQTKVELSWGSSIFEEKMILSDGSSLDPANLIIEFGSFDNSFAPDHTNMGQWLGEWRVFDAVKDTDPTTATNDTDPNDSFTNQSGGTETARYEGMAHLLADATSDSVDAAPSYTWSPGEQGYLFIRTSDNFVPSTEWVLLTSNSAGQHVGDSVWEFPAVTGGQGQFPLAWWLDDADAAVFGAVDGGSGNGGDTGGGDFTDTSTDFGLRLHRIPEPGTGLLALLSAPAFFRRRRRP